jgi:S1-C subfamily serine protease
MQEFKRNKSVPPAAIAAIASLSVASGTGCLSSRPPPPPINLAGISREVEAQPRPQAFDAPLELVEKHDAIVRIVTGGSACTGTMIAPDLVLTAHHCVADLTDPQPVPRLRPTKDINVEFGGDFLAWGTVPVRHIVVPPCGARGGEGDLAILVLQKKVANVPTLRVRLSREPNMGEPIDAYGFGLCATSEGIRRRQRVGGPIRAMTGGTVEVDAAICPGDSGGPLLARGSDEVVAVVSMSRMDGAEWTKGLSVMARLDTFRPLFAKAKLISEGNAPEELPPLACP